MLDFNVRSVGLKPGYSYSLVDKPQTTKQEVAMPP